ncbi:CYTH and CHAD domain-containing protein [Actinophytocola sp.]|uniref:CYTH and CHAD domain-containing protein n=1 Tax=Actinophytocola sp. TaxID=1872138 RepID=UPI002D806662|nr:CYTH and CHAD domain-containing protein [Actinophytocola sp.]HET9143929.1 CYTH and CHAD domain-containing protein [Actinophytocola sp.]
MKATTHAETERKYELGPDTRLPVLDGLPGVVASSDPETEELDAVYFDTADLRLARSGVTLRRRSGGPDAGWHLKVPVGPDTRDETRVPLGAAGEEPPVELTDLLTGHTRGAALVPVARISTRRDRRRLLGADGPLAEVTDDLVTGWAEGDPATADTWREVEVELADGTDAAFLDRAERRLAKAGIRRSAVASKLARVLDVRPERADRPATAGETVLAYLREQADALTRADLLVRKGAADSVHKLRVAARKMRSALRVFGRIVDRDRTRDLAGELRWLGARLAPARDLEVQYERFHAAATSLPAELLVGPVRGRLTRHFGPAEAAARREAMRTLRGKRYLRLLAAIDRLLAEPPLTAAARRPAGRELPRHVRRAHRKVARRLRDARRTAPGPDRDAQLHRMRKAAKRFRYAVVAVRPVLGKPARRTANQARTLTRVLGEFQDSVMARPVLRELGMRAQAAAENAFTFGLLYGREEHIAARAERELDRAWRRTTTRKARSWFR